MKHTPILQRLLEGFEKKSQDECWPWKGRLTTNGYAPIWLGRNSIPHRTHAHRLMFNLRYGAIPEGLQACHHCDNRKCVNPRHVFLGTHKDNAQDRERKGRGHPRMGIPLVKNRGIGNGNSRLTAHDVIRLRAMLALGAKDRDVAREFGMSPSCIRDIRIGKSYTAA